MWKGKKKLVGKLKLVVIMLWLNIEFLFSLHSKGEQESSPNVVTSMLQVFS